MQLELLIPIIAIVGGLSLGGFKEWLKFKSKQQQLGASTHELQEEVSFLRESLDASEGERKRMTERIENLETIVTSESWDALHEGAESRALGTGAASSLGAARTDALEEEVERLARRVQQ